MSRWIWAAIITFALIGASFVVNRARAGDTPNPWREIRALNRAIQTLQEVNNRQTEEIDILRSIPVTKEQYEAEKRKRERARR